MASNSIPTDAPLRPPASLIRPSGPSGRPEEGFGRRTELDVLDGPAITRIVWAETVVRIGRVRRGREHGRLSSWQRFGYNRELEWIWKRQPDEFRVRGQRHGRLRGTWWLGKRVSERQYCARLPKPAVLSKYPR